MYDAIDFETADGLELSYVRCPHCLSDRVEDERDGETQRVRYICHGCGEVSEWG